jgi:pimeloyl-ACP methyl ester carboxylesterase
MGGTSLGWIFVEEATAQFTSVCSYDRAGYAWSDESPHERTSENIAQELHTLLHKAGIPGPYILVGHSFGGCNMLLFADRYPEETAGIVLVDSVHEEQLDKMPPEPDLRFVNKFLSHPKVKLFLVWTGISRLLGPSIAIKEMFRPLPKAIQRQYVAQMYKPGYTKVVAEEWALFKKSLEQLKRAQGNFKDKPLIVVTASQTIHGEDPFSCEGNKIWNGLQRELVLKSTRGKQLMAEHSDHMVNHHQPEIIVEAIKLCMEGC